MARSIIQFVRLTRVAFSVNPTATTLDNVNGNFSANDGGTFLELNNTAGATRTVSVEVPGDVDADLPVSSRTFTLLAGQVGKTGVFPREVYGSQLLVDVSGTGVTAVAYSIR
jgi:hypothetical protein